MPTKKKTAKKTAKKVAKPRMTADVKRAYEFKQHDLSPPEYNLAKQRFADSIKRGGYVKLIKDAKVRAEKITDHKKLFAMWQILSLGAYYRRQAVMLEGGPEAVKDFDALIDSMERKLVKFGY
jgi:hypothetical protein